MELIELYGAKKSLSRTAPRHLASWKSERHHNPSASLEGLFEVQARIQGGDNSLTFDKIK
jgi:hypothetical protein